MASLFVPTASWTWLPWDYKLHPSYRVGILKSCVDFPSEIFHRPLVLAEAGNLPVTNAFQQLSGFFEILPYLIGFMGIGAQGDRNVIVKAHMQEGLVRVKFPTRLVLAVGVELYHSVRFF